MRNGQNGQAMVEFALILPVFLLIITVAFSLGFAFAAKQVAANAAGLSAMYWSENPAATTSDIDSECENAAKSMLSLNAGEITLSVQDANGNPVPQPWPSPLPANDYVTVAVTVPAADVPGMDALSGAMSYFGLNLSGISVSETFLVQ